jgi:hypothetical protein
MTNFTFIFSGKTWPTLSFLKKYNLHIDLTRIIQNTKDRAERPNFLRKIIFENEMHILQSRKWAESMSVNVNTRELARAFDAFPKT